MTSNIPQESDDKVNKLIAKIDRLTKEIMFIERENIFEIPYEQYKNALYILEKEREMARQELRLKNAGVSG